MLKRITFFAIGAAHIPGVEGVVNLLRQKGFTVSPVRSSSRIAPENYTYQYKDLPWNEVYIFDSAYTLQTPGACISTGGFSTNLARGWRRHIEYRGKRR